MSPAEFCIITVVSFPFEENTYIVSLPGRGDCFVIDPGLEPEKILKCLQEKKFIPAAILITHAHSDHIAGNGSLKNQWPDCPLVVGKGDALKLADPRQNLSALFGMALESPPADQTVEDGETYAAAGITLKILAIPGHSSGHVVYLVDSCDPPVCFVGDVIFAGSIGRTDFPDGDSRELIDGIREKLFTLPDGTVLYPGHGPPTTVGREKRFNPFLK
ncbi:MAG: MBL fold metallo-hydrolase [Pirellulales bacterium]|nr:MBL fold metallo-hydrolase [Pirellulales bacterium]